MTTALMMPYLMLYYPICNMVNEETSAAVVAVSTGVTYDVIRLAAQFLFLKYSYPRMGVGQVRRLQRRLIILLSHIGACLLLLAGNSISINKQCCEHVLSSSLQI